MTPAEVRWAEIEPLVEGLRLTTIAPEIPGGLELITRMQALGVRVSIGHSAADLDTAGVQFQLRRGAGDVVVA